MSDISTLERFTQWLTALPKRPADITVDSRRVFHSPSLFAALPGKNFDGRNYINEAIDNGAVGIVLEQQGQQTISANVPIFSVNNLRNHLSAIADIVYGKPSERLHVIGVTGTNGKTSCAYWITQAMNYLGRNANLIGTLGYGDWCKLIPLSNTTPDAARVQELLGGFARRSEKGDRSDVVMEVSSIGLAEERVNAVRFETVLFTNLSHDHMDYHGTMDAYLEAKARLFACPTLQNAVINIRDPAGKKLAAITAGNGIPTLRYSIDEKISADIVAHNISRLPFGTAFDVITPFGKARIESKVTGSFNIENLLGVLGVLLARKVSFTDAAKILSRITPPPGRMQRLGEENTPRVIVDYAHTPDALRHVLQTLRTDLNETQRLYCVFGCGGDRDKEKRAPMGYWAGRLADKILVTSDNPRSESPEEIVRQVVQGLNDSGNAEWEIELNRAAAIDKAIAMARCGDIVLIAGKGHENYQEIIGKRYSFSDVEAATRSLQKHHALYAVMWDLFNIVQDLRWNYPKRNIRRIITDSREAQVGDLFFALRGERFDGHDFVDDVLKLGACAVVSKAQASRFVGSNVIVVDNPLKALGELARYWRTRHGHTKVILVVGSNGKTTVKEMLTHILRMQKGEHCVHATQGNLNNAVGLPLTLLQLRPIHDFAVIELGMNHRGETAELARYAQPNIVVINNAQREHQEFMNDVETVAKEHGDAFAATWRDLSIPVPLEGEGTTNGIAVLNADDHYASFWKNEAEKQNLSIYTFGEHSDTAKLSGRFFLHPNGVDITVTSRSQSIEDKSTTFTLPLLGKAMAHNALAALAVARVLAIPLEDAAYALSQFKATKGRLLSYRINDHFLLIDDTYNANPDSVRAAIDVLKRQSGKRWLVFGDMAEVGERGIAFHREIGMYAKKSGIDRLYATGTLTQNSIKMFGKQGAYYSKNRDTLIAKLREDSNEEGSLTVLIKGSRFMEMEKVVEALLKNDQGVESRKTD
ncbi:MAG: UDP-N-acetylmuramoyl-L-alanyl-D-glutamate--2,6-diaminopimelate ligase [Burkholderiales bacterium]|jgi:murE/murF fusion protein|nr:UDP-N-acetylmuramoyl-L-alanyl-D-glutamate--2,6-diaminopimelate ligase [Burkholderiales bacterium]